MSSSIPPESNVFPPVSTAASLNKPTKLLACQMKETLHIVMFAAIVQRLPRAMVLNVLLVLILMSCEGCMSAVISIDERKGCWRCRLLTSSCLVIMSSSLGSTRLAHLQLAHLALPDEPVRALVAQVAVPQHEGGVGFDHAEGVLAFAGFGHCEGLGWVGLELMLVAVVE